MTEISRSNCHEALDDGRPPAKLFQRRERLFLAADERLPLAVIAEAPGLQDRGQLHMRQRIAQALLVMHVGVIGDRDAEPAHEVLLNETVLSDGERIGRRIDRSLFPGDFERAGRHVLELASDHVHARGKGAERSFVLEGSDRARRGDVEGRRARLIGINVAVQPEPRRGECQHAAELAAAKNADGASQRQDFRHYPLVPRRRLRSVPRATP